MRPSWPWEVTCLRISAACLLIFLPSLALQHICLVLMPTCNLVLTWVAPLCLGRLLQLLVFHASLLTCHLQNSWLGLLSFLLQGLMQHRDPCHVGPYHRCLHKCHPRQGSLAIGLPLLKLPNLAMLPLSLFDLQPPRWTASRHLYPATPPHNTTLSHLQPQLVTLCLHR